MLSPEQYQQVFQGRENEVMDEIAIHVVQSLILGELRVLKEKETPFMTESLNEHSKA